MWKTVRTFIQDPSGSVPVEWTLLATILVLGAITGALAVRDNTLREADAALRALSGPAAAASALSGR